MSEEEANAAKLRLDAEFQKMLQLEKDIEALDQQKKQVENKQDDVHAEICKLLGIPSRKEMRWEMGRPGKVFIRGQQVTFEEYNKLKNKHWFLERLAKGSVVEADFDDPILRQKLEPWTRRRV